MDIYDRPDYLFEDEDNQEFYETLEWSDVDEEEQTSNIPDDSVQPTS